MARRLPVPHHLQFLLQTSGWRCPTRYLPPVEPCFGRYPRKQMPALWGFQTQNYRRTRWFVDGSETPCSCLGGQEGGAMQYEALVTILPGRGQAQLLGRTHRLHAGGCEMVAAAIRLLPLATPPAASSSFGTSGKQLPAARAKTEQGGEKPETWGGFGWVNAPRKRRGHGFLVKIAGTWGFGVL